MLDHFLDRPGRPASRRKRRYPSSASTTRSTGIGGAANVAHNVVALGARARSSASSAPMPKPRPARGPRRRADVGTDGLVTDAARPTTREGAGGHRPQSAGRAHRLRAGSRGASRTSRPADRTGDVAGRPRAGAIVVSDYLKGAITGRLVAELGEWRAAAACRCWSIRRFRTSATTAARRWSRRTITKPRSPPICAFAPTRTRATAARGISASAPDATACSSRAANTACGC